MFSSSRDAPTGERNRLPFILPALAFFAACFSSPNYEGRLCGLNDECPSGYACITSLGICSAHSLETPDCDAGGFQENCSGSNPPSSACDSNDDCSSVETCALPTRTCMAPDGRRTPPKEAPNPQISNQRTGLLSRIEERTEGPRIVPVDLLSTPIAAHVSSPGGEPFDIHLGQGGRDGRFIIPGVPPGEILLQLGTRFYATNQAYFSSREVVIGRDAPPVDEAAPPSLRVELAGLKPWGLTDRLVLSAPNASTYDVALASRLALATGDTSVARSFIVPSDYRLIDGTVGDIVYVGQLERSQSTTGIAHATLVRLASEARFTLRPRADSTLKLAMQNVAATKQISLVFCAAHFLAAGPVINPEASALDAWAVQIRANRFAPDGIPSQRGDVPPLLNVAFDPKSANQDSGVIPYGNPYPSSWALAVAVETPFSLRVALRGAEAVTLFAGLTSEGPLDTLNALACMPVVTPPVHLLINRVPAFQALPPVTLTPFLEWDPPATGRATAYSLEVLELSVQDLRTRARSLATLEMTAPHIQLPSGILSAGKSYVFRLTALAEGGRARGTASLISSVFSP